MRRRGLMILVAAGLAGAAAAQSGEAGSVPPAVEATAGPVGSYADADALLSALETADAGLESLRADIRYDRTFDLEGDNQVRVGQMWFDAGVRSGKTAGPRRFAVRFDTLIVGRTQRSETRVHVFDGRWYADKVPGERRMSRREVVAPGETFDPLKVGEGPLPIPIGQKKADILKRYDATLLPATDSVEDKTLAEFVAGSVQLKLTPRPELKGSDDFREIRIWYRGKSPGEMTAADKPGARLLPRMARTVNRSGDVSIVQLINVEINEQAPLDESVMSAEPEAGWTVVETGLRSAPAKPEETVESGGDKVKKPEKPREPEPEGSPAQAPR